MSPAKKNFLGGSRKFLVGQKISKKYHFFCQIYPFLAEIFLGGGFKAEDFFRGVKAKHPVPHTLGIMYG